MNVYIKIILLMLFYINIIFGSILYYLCKNEIKNMNNLTDGVYYSVNITSTTGSTNMEPKTNKSKTIIIAMMTLNIIILYHIFVF
jgi:hypothetical protein